MWSGIVISISGSETLIHGCVRIDVPSLSEFAGHELRVGFTAPISEKHHYVRFSLQDRVNVDAQLRECRASQGSNCITCVVNIRRLSPEARSA